MNKQDAQLESFVERPPPTPLVWGGVGLISGLFLHLFAFMAVMRLVPRINENSRSVVDLPFEIYATMPTAIAMAVTIPLGFIKLGTRRIAFWIGATLGIAFLTFFGQSLLQRDYIGTF